MNDLSMNQWLSQLGNDNDNSAPSSGNVNENNAFAGGTGMTIGVNNASGQQGHGSMDNNSMAAMNMMNNNMDNNNMNNMFLLNTLTGNGGPASNGGNGVPPRDQANFMSNNGPTNNNMNNNTGNMMHMNGMNTNGMPQSSNGTATVIKVKTGESVSIPTFSGGMGSPVPTFNNHNGGNIGGGGGGNNNYGEIARSNSEPMLNTMMNMMGNNEPSYEQVRPASTDLHSSMQQLGGIDNPNQNNHFGSNNNPNMNMGHGNNNSLMENFNNMLNNPPSSMMGAAGGASNRRHSEPAFNLLADIFDEPAGVEDNHASGGGMNMGDANLEGNTMSSRSGDGWSSPLLQETNLDDSFSNPKRSRKRASSAPLISEMVFNLDDLEPEQVFDKGKPKGGSAVTSNKQDMIHQLFNTFESTNSDNPSAEGTGQVKRSRSVDPLEMFRRSEEDSLFVTNQSSHSQPAHAMANEVHSNITQDEQARLEAMGVYSREKPKRRRSAPLLSQDIFGDIFNEDENGNTKSQGEQTETLTQTNDQYGSSFAPGQAPQDIFNSMQKNNGPQDSQEKNNVNLIQMLLGIEGGGGNKGMPQGTNHSGGVTQDIHQQMQMPPQQSAPMPAAAPVSQQQPSSFNMSRSISTDTAPAILQSSQQLQSPTSVAPVAMHSMAPQQIVTASAPMAPGQISQQQIPSNNGPLGNAPLQQQQIPINNDYVNNSNPHANQTMFKGQQVGNTFGAPVPATSQSQAPPPLSINNSEDLTLVLSAVKETQTNLRTLQPMVMQLGDPVAMEDIAKAFKITASSSQFVLASDLPSAYSALNEAWAKIKKLEDRLAQGNQQQQMFNMANNNPPFPGGMMGQMGLPQMVPTQFAGGILPNNGATVAHPVMMDLTNPSQIPSILTSNNTYIPIAHVKTKKGSNPTTPTSLAKPKANIKGLKNSPVSTKRRSKTKKVPSPPPSPIEKVVELEDLPAQNKDDPDIIMKRLQGLMERTQMSQKQLQRWDKKNGLPKSHSQTMVNSSRSRRQLQKGVILKKWNGDPLITESEKGAAKKSQSEDKQKETDSSSEQPGEIKMSEAEEQKETDSSSEQPGEIKMSEEKAENSTCNTEVTNPDTATSGTVSTEVSGDSEMLNQKKSDDDIIRDDDISMDPSEILSDALLTS